MGFKSNEFALMRVTYMYGCLDGAGQITENLNDLGDGLDACIKIAEDWAQEVDIQSQEEQGYPQAYAQRVLLERFGK